MMNRKQAIDNYNEAVKVAKAIYVVSGLQEMVTYLDAKVQLDYITEEDYDEIVTLVSAAYANVTVGELDKIRKMF